MRCVPSWRQPPGPHHHHLSCGLGDSRNLMLPTFLHWCPSRPFLYTVNVPTPVELHVVQDKVPAPRQVPPRSLLPHPHPSKCSFSPCWSSVPPPSLSPCCCYLDYAIPSASPSLSPRRSINGTSPFPSQAQYLPTALPIIFFA